MGQELEIIDDRSSDGRATSQLSAKHRAFVLALVRDTSARGSVLRAAEAAGYHPSYGYLLMRNESVLAALHEESAKRVRGATLAAINSIAKIAEDDDHKDQFKAAKEIAAMNGFNPDQHIVVEHISHDSKEKLKRIYEYSKKLGLDPKQLLQAAGISNIEDAEFSEMPEDTEMDAVEDGDDQ